MSIWKSLGIAGALLIAVAACAPHGYAQATPSLVTVIPLARSAAFEYRMDLVPNTPWTKSDTGLWVDKTHRATLEWRFKGDTTWKKATDFVRVTSRPDLPAAYYPISDPRLATMLFGLQEGKSYDYRVTVFAPGYPTEPVTGTFTTLTANVPTGSGSTIVIPANTPDIYAAIKTALGPFSNNCAGKTIAFKANVDASGKPVPTVIRQQIAGMYDPVTSQGTGRIFGWSGAPDAWLTLTVAPGNDVTFDGSDPAFDVKGGGLWEPVPEGTVLKDYAGKDTTISASMHLYRTKAPVVYNRPVQALYYETERGGSAWRLIWFSAIPAGTASTNAAIPDGLRSRCIEPAYGDSGGYKWSNGISELVTASKSGSPGFIQHTDGRLYVYLNGGKDPESVYVKIPYLNSPLHLQAQYYQPDIHNVKVSGLKIQYFRGPWVGVNLQFEPKVEMGGISIITSQNIVIQDCLLKGIGSGIMGGGKSIVIKNCTITQRGLSPEYDPVQKKWVGPAWNYVKLSLQEGIALPISGIGVSILDSTVEGWNDGVVCGGGNNVPVADYSGNQKSYAEGMEVDNCTFRGIVDDCFEPTDYNVCIAATNNTMRRSYKGLACPRAQGGPIFFIRNKWLGQGEYVAFADRQAPTKLGHPNVPDTARKFIANNTFVNSYVPQNGLPGTPTLVGISGSGNSYNIVALNNYVACDGAAIDWPYGALGYDHIFDNNIYVELHKGQQPTQYSGSWAGSWGSAGIPLMDGDDPWAQNGNGYRYYNSFASWQMGKNDHLGTNMPGYTGSIPDRVVEATTGGAVRMGMTLAPKSVRWMHDSHGHAYDNQPNDLVGFPTGVGAPVNGFDLAETFNFRPRSGGWGVGQGTPIPNITFDCGPGWSANEERGAPTVGAYPGGGGATTPTLSLTTGVTGAPGVIVSVPMVFAASSGTISTVTASVTGPDGAAVDSVIKGKTAGSASVEFTPLLVGTHIVTATVTDNKGAATTAKTTVAVSAPQVPSGSITVTMTPSKRTVLPGEPVVYTVVVSNPTDRAMTNVVLNQQVPKHTTLNLSSAVLDGKPITVTVDAGAIHLSLGSMTPNTQHVLTITAVVN